MTRSLVGIAFDGLGFLPKPGDPVTIDGRDVGKVTSADTGYTLRPHARPGLPRTNDRRRDLRRRDAADGTSATGVVHHAALYDPDRSRARA